MKNNREHILQLTDMEKALLHKVLTYQMVDVEFMASFKGSQYNEEKRALKKLMDKVQKLNDL